MKDKRLPIIILGGIILAGSLIFLYFNREKIFPQPKETETTTEPLLPEVKTTTVTTTVSGFTELPKKEESLGKITNYKVLQDFSGTYSILVLEGGIKEGTKLYMPYDGKISYQNQGGKIYNFQIYSADGEKVITILGALKPKCKVTSVGFYGQVSFCENVKKGEVIAEVGKEELESTFPNFVFQIWGYNNNKSDLNLLYENLKTVFK
jgi:hypothetical protein